MDDEDVEERESDEENLLSENLELQRLAVGTSSGNKWRAFGYLQCCKSDFMEVISLCVCVSKPHVRP